MSSSTKSVFADVLKQHKAGASIDTVVEAMAARGITSKDPAKTLGR